ncbi:hypothetical protein HNP69_002590 [Chryseobacterium koreense]|nr:hypothetical protein [Chryseobacterium koreense]
MLFLILLLTPLQPFLHQFYWLLKLLLKRLMFYKLIYHLLYLILSLPTHALTRESFACVALSILPLSHKIEVFTKLI